MCKGFLASIGKNILAGIMALLTLTGFCYFYYNVPVHNDNLDGATDYKWEANAFYSRGTEGFAWGKTNNEGFTNTFNYNPDTPADILVMGSSHMEGFQIAMNESVAGRLNTMIKGKIVYNIGISGHNFTTCCCNLEAAIKKYNPEFIIMETGSCIFSDEALSNAINGTVAEIPSHAGGIIGTLQKNQYLRLLYVQIKNYRKKQTDDNEDIAPMILESSKNESTNNDELLSELLQRLNKIANNHGATIIIMYHPGTTINSDGSLRLSENVTAKEQFSEACLKSDIYFLDMSDRFMREYEESYTLPYGFANTSVGNGHLNKYGHAMIADELYKLISEVA